MTSRGTWKAYERKIAKEFKTFRTPLSGSLSRHTESDTLHDKYYIEVKMRSKIPFWNTFMDTVEKAKKEKKIPMFIFRKKGQHTNVIMMKLKDFKKLVKGGLE